MVTDGGSKLIPGARDTCPEMSWRDGYRDQPNAQSGLGASQIRPGKLASNFRTARAHLQNYVELDDDEDDVEMNGDDEDDDFDDEEYSDNEDDSWKIRRSAAKLLQSIFGTRLELLLDFYDNAAGVLISRFSEREESVRVEVLAAFEVLLDQTAITRTAELASGGRNKRKRSHDMDEDTSQEDS